MRSEETARRLNRIWRWRALLVLLALAPAAQGQPDGKGGCLAVTTPDAANFSSHMFSAVGSLTANSAPSPYVERAKGGQVGTGYWAPSKQPHRKDGCKMPIPHHWKFLLQTNFLYNQTGVQQSGIEKAIAANPQNVGLFGAVGGIAKYYSWTVDPTFQILVSNTVRLYVFGGSGWFRRTISFSGASNEGTLLQASAPGVFGESGNSAVMEGGVGFDVGRPRKTGRPHGFPDLRFYMEFRALHGLAINNSSVLYPISAGIRW